MRMLGSSPWLVRVRAFFTANWGLLVTARRLVRPHGPPGCFLIAEAGVEEGIAFICGSNGFVETASQLALEAGFGPELVRTERFGPTG
jgi:hypothetical protein